MNCQNLKDNSVKIRCFADTDTLYIVFSQKTPVETRDLDENTLLDLE